MAMDLRAALADELEEVRRRSLYLLAPLSDDEVSRQHSPLMSPLVWDLAHVANYEELWLLRALAGAAPIDPALDDIYDAFRHPRKNRPALALLGPGQALRYAAEVRSRALDVLDQVSLDDESDDLLAGAFVYGMVIQHEHQHDETMLATMQLGGLPAPTIDRSSLAAVPAELTIDMAAEVLVPAGPFTMGSDADPWCYDNERPAHSVDLPAFWIDTFPVTNRRYAEFVEDGGYDHQRWWSEQGWAWRTEAGLAHPQFWQRDPGGSWWRQRFGHLEPVPANEPVQHVCWYEAAAFAGWAGRRLPSEAEWEKAASWSADGKRRAFPWGDDVADTPSQVANLGQSRLGPAPVGTYPAGASPCGAQQLVGDVWEWTSSDFAPYPGFSSFPYREYSEVFFGSGYKVLRGGSWATHPRAVRTTFRNWDHPIRRQIFAGFRCARDA